MIISNPPVSYLACNSYVCFLLTRFVRHSNIFCIILGLKMVANFDFLKKVDKNLFEIIDEAEKLYRDEYFEQCMTQTRRFGENVCKKVLGKNRTTEDTFDEMLATLKDKGSGEEQEKEFIDDLYFLKKYGNNSTHSSKVKKDGMDALECLKRAFEVAISYAVYNKGAKADILKLRYDTELLVTGKKAKKSLAEKYSEEKARSAKKNRKSSKKSINVFPLSEKAATKKVQKKKSNKQYYTMSSRKKKKGIPVFWIFVGVSLFVSVFLIFVMFLISL